jgi:hypothetical protein
MIGITSRGDFRKTTTALTMLLRGDPYSNLTMYGEMGVEALSKATPVDTSLTANSWKYRIRKGKRPGIEWYNTNEVNGTPVVILIQYGHATGNGAYIAGRDFINPAIKPIFDKIADDVWKKVRNG